MVKHRKVSKCETGCRFHEFSWEIIKSIKGPNESFKKFIAILLSVYDGFFPKSRIRVRHNKRQRQEKDLAKAKRHLKAELFMIQK